MSQELNAGIKNIILDGAGWEFNTRVYIEFLYYLDNLKNLPSVWLIQS